ncbi:hypothetical protein BGZ60DRAFT_431851 [Tricladium varicosporioides]|nr:hypothetical protein BGZ60DRAFT_431851 [Hymenoscyphus varicosporioides]
MTIDPPVTDNKFKLGIYDRPARILFSSLAAVMSNFIMRSMIRSCVDSGLALVDESVARSIRVFCLVHNYNPSKIQLGWDPSPSPYSCEIFRESAQRATQRSLFIKFSPSSKSLEHVR